MSNREMQSSRKSVLGSVSERGVHAPIPSPGAATATREDGLARETSPQNRLSATLHRWLPTWLAVYFAFLAGDIIIPDSPLASALKYLGIFLCLIYVYRTRRKDTLLLLALTFTFLADTILIWTHQFVFGIFIFTFAHYFHITRFTKTTPRFLTYYYLIVVSVFLFVLLLGFSPIYAIASTYALSLLANLLLSARWYHQEPSNPHARAALAGFILFSLCDICVATQFLSTQGIFSAALYPLVTYLVWLFYYPSQILIANSSTAPSA